MKIECRKRQLPGGTTMFVDLRGQTIYFDGVECESSYKTVFQPEKPPQDLKHEEFVNALKRSRNGGFLTEGEMERRIRRGRPVTVWTKPIGPVEEKKKITPATADIDVIMENIRKLHKQITWPKDENYFPHIKTEKAEENKEDGEESCMQKEDAAYVGSVCDHVFRSSVIHAV